MACFFRLFFNLNQTFMFRTIFLLLLMVLLFDGCYRMRTSKGGGQISAIPQRHIDASDVALPRGYTIQPVTSGLTFPTAVTTDDDGNLYAIEAGYSYGEVWGEPKLLNIDHNGKTSVIARGTRNGPWTGITWYKGAFYVAEGGEMDGGKILKITEGTC
jgi:hypothetical protein